jgi:hypothetical protein
LEPRDEGCRLACREAGRVVDRDVLRDGDLVVGLEGVPVDVEEIVVLVGRGGARHAAHGDERHRGADLVLGDPEVGSGLLHGHPVVLEQPGNEREQERELVARLRRRHRARRCAVALVSHGRPPSSAVAR